MESSNVYSDFLQGEFLNTEMYLGYTSVVPVPTMTLAPLAAVTTHFDDRSSYPMDKVNK